MESQLFFSGDRAEKYKYLEYLGTYPLPPIAITARCELVPNRMAVHLNRSRYDFFSDNKSDYVVTNSTAQHLEVSVMKMDQPVVYEFRKDVENYDAAMAYVARMYDNVFRQRSMEVHEMLDDITFDSSPGIVESRRGYRKKVDCVVAGLPAAEYEHPDLNEIPIWKVSGKRELKLRTEYVGQWKQRTFIIQPFHFFWMTKKEYGLQNEAMKMTGWSFYGFNPYEGGVNKLVHTLMPSSKFKRFWMLDGKGWDRIFAMMHEVWSMRMKYKEMTLKQRYIYHWMVNSVLMLPDGDKIFKSWGNNSGSSTTTGDNIIGMSLVLAHVFFFLGLTREQLDECIRAAIFGDDLAGADCVPVSNDTLEKAFRFVFTDLYGVTLDPFVITHNIEDIEFLGFKIKKIAGGYIPVYPLGRLACSMIMNDSPMEPSAEFGKMSSLMLMSAGHGETVFNFFRDSLVDVIASTDDPALSALRSQNLSASIPDYGSVIEWYLGYEASGVGGFIHDVGCESYLYEGADHMCPFVR